MIKKLSKPQQEVIDLMRDGWELGTSMIMDSRSWLQKGGCGRGGDTKEVNASTKHALYVRGLIERKTTEFPLVTWKLVDEQS